MQLRNTAELPRYGRPETILATRRYVEIAHSCGLTPTQLAIAFCPHKPCIAIASTIVGATSVAQLQQCLDSAEVAHEKTPGRSQVFWHPLGGPGEARAGGGLEKTPGRSQVFWHPLGGPGEARAGGALKPRVLQAIDAVRWAMRDAAQ